MPICCNIFLLSSNQEGSKSNIAAKFQNALNLQILPPIGVFWDIENCQVPKGKSAIALVQNIREKFFSHHREAEFMCVCDINKESKIVIQELILAQVTVVHISATSKNAADDKLKQCMRRFVDTHGAPSTLLLISDDVNFASDLSDFRHRHNIRIILLHRGHAHQSLLACAHEHYEFAIVAYDLPFRSPVKASDSRPNELVVTDLPTNRNIAMIKNQLKKLSQNCGGKVIHIRGSKAFMRFANAEAAERAKRRMDKEIVYGNEISVNFPNRSEPEFNYSPPRDHLKGFNSSNEPTGSSSSSRDSSISPPRESNGKFKNYECYVPSKKFDFPPPPLLDGQNCPKLFKYPKLSEDSQFQCIKDSDSFLNINMETIKESKNFQLDWNKDKYLYHTGSGKCQEASAFSPFKKDQDSNYRSRYPRNVGRVSPFFMQECDKTIRNIASIHQNESTAGRKSHSRSEMNSSPFPFYSNHSFHGLAQNVSMALSEMQRISDPVIYSSQWNGTPVPTDSGYSVSQASTVQSLDSSPVELCVSNLDPTFEVNEMKKNLLAAFREHVMVLHISMALQPDGTAKATVKVPSLQDAQFAISRLHRKKIGHKRILIAYTYSDKSPPFHVLRSEVVALLNDIPNKNLPLVKFRELYEKRYHRPIAVSELNRLRDAVSIQGDSGSRVVHLNVDYHKTPSLPESLESEEAAVEKPYCARHFHVSASQGWAERYSALPLPLIHISLKTFSAAVHTLLDSHQGSLPLISFCDCYEEEIGPLPIIGSFENTQMRDSVSDLTSNSVETSVNTLKGVPLEHLIVCITGVEVAKSAVQFKKVQWLENKTDSQVLQNFSPALLGQLTTFGREVMDLLKSQPRCLVPFNKFIPVYHHHFGKQCRVADYGFTKLIDLLEAIPHIVQVLGEGQNRQVTLTHRTQVKRFSGELLRILKARASKQITISEFPEAYEEVIEKSFEITNYGVCEIEDMLDEVPDNVIVTCNSGNETVIAIPKREQTSEEVERTKQFADEVIELMKQTPHCTMAFNKFIPAYHHHFGKQCRVADYGFTKLIELFEAVPFVLEVKGSGEDKILNLVEKEQHKILSQRLASVLKVQPNQTIEINQLRTAYAQMHGHILRPFDFGFSNFQELVEKMNSNIMLFTRSGGIYVILVDHVFLHQLSLNVRCLLMEYHEGKMPVKDLDKIYEMSFNQIINVSSYLKNMEDVIKVSDDFIELTPLHLLARDMIILLQENGNQIPLSSFGSLFQQKFGNSICTANYGFPNMFSMLENLSHYFSIKGKKQKRVVHLITENISTPLKYLNSSKIVSSIPDLMLKHNDILSQPVPSCVPSPSLEPHIKERLEDLMGFETPPFEGAESCCGAILHEENLKHEIFISNKAQEITSSDGVPQTVGNDAQTELSHPVLPQMIPVTSTTNIPSSSSVSVRLYSSVSVRAENTCGKRAESSYIELQKVQINSVVKETKSSQLFPDPPEADCRDSELKSLSVSSSKGKPRITAKFSSDQSIAKRSKIDSHSFEDLTSYSQHLQESKGRDLSSTKSTPTRITGQLNRRSRIAAQFSSPIKD